MKKALVLLAIISQLLVLSAFFQQEAHAHGVIWTEESGNLNRINEDNGYQEFCDYETSFCCSVILY